MLSSVQILRVFFLLVIAAFIRFFHFDLLPFSHDELSALSRLNYESLGDLLAGGVKPDGHPALIQVFLFYWCKLFGYSEMVVKFPFIIMGIASVLLVYLIGLRWFSEQGAFLSALMVSLTQFFIVYSQYARPYISGSLLCLLLVFFWLRILFGSSKRISDYFFFGLFLFLAAVNHHLSMLFAFLCFVSGLFFLPKAELKRYIISACVAALFYIPHLPITLSQFSIGGVGGWLSPPRPDFLFYFLFYLFHYSWITLSVVALVLLFSVFKGKSTLFSPSENRIRLIFFLLFFLSWLIAHIYSIYRNPILQFSTLIFSAPLFILFLFSFYRPLPKLQFFVSVFLIAFTFIFSLLYNRMYLELNFRQGFDRFVAVAKDFEVKHPGKKISILARSENWFMDFYRNRYNFKGQIVCQRNEDFLSPHELSKLLDTLSADYILLGNLEPLQVASVSNYFRFDQYAEYGYSYELYVLGRTKGNSKDFDFRKVKQVFTTDFNTDNSFRFSHSHIFSDSMRPHKYKKHLMIPQTDEFPLSFQIPISKLKAERGDYLLASAELDGLSDSIGRICFSVAKDSDSFFYTDALIAGHNSSVDTHRNLAYASMYCGDNFLEWKNANLKVYLWNQFHQASKVKNISVRVINVNPYRYALLEPISTPDSHFP
jgi:hypothetical protein